MDFEKQRQQMVKNQLSRRGIRNDAVLQAMATVPRESFVPDDMTQMAYEDSPLPIGQGQTISQPYIVAVMIEHLELHSGDRVLEIGTGSGYGAAVLSRIAAEVYTVERRASLAEEARDRLQNLGYDNVHVHVGDGSLGWPDNAPYDAILVTAGAPDVPRPLKDQLAVDGRLVIPTGQRPIVQSLVRLRKNAPDDFTTEQLEAVRFVPLVGEAGWQESEVSH